MAPDALSIGRVMLSAPYARVILAAKGGLNVDNLVRPVPASISASAPATTKPVSARAAASAPAPAPSMPIGITRIDIRDGVLDFSDRSVTPNFSTAIYGLNGSIVGLSSDPASRATVMLDGSVDRYAPVSIQGQVNVLSAAAYTDINMSFSNIELPTFNPYSGKFAGYNIAQGKLSTQLQYHIENRQLDARHHIVVDQLEFGDATQSKQAVPLPVKLAVSLLKDRDGVITLDLPVGGSLDDPQFHVGPVIWKVLVGLLTKIVTAPFAAIGAAFGGGHELSYLDFPAGVATLTPAQLEKLTKLSDALVNRPQLKLDIPLHTQGDDDDEALERVGMERALRGLAAPATGKRLAALAALYRAQFQTAPVYPPEITAGADPDADRAAWLESQLLPQFAPDDAARDALALARARAVQAAVLSNTELKPERVFLVNQVSGGGSPGLVRMELKLE
jgi:hypothetical protein